MRFHDPLVAMRRRGRRPESVFLLVDCADDEDGAWHARDPGHARIAIDPADAPHRLDMRFVVGCTVHVQGFDDARVKAVYEAAVNAGARVVAAVFDGDAQSHWREAPQSQEARHG